MKERNSHPVVKKSSRAGTVPFRATALNWYTIEGGKRKRTMNANTCASSGGAPFDSVDSHLAGTLISFQTKEDDDEPHDESGRT